MNPHFAVPITDPLPLYFLPPRTTCRTKHVGGRRMGCGVFGTGEGKSSSLPPLTNINMLGEQS